MDIMNDMDDTYEADFLDAPYEKTKDVAAVEAEEFLLSVNCPQDKIKILVDAFLGAYFDSEEAVTNG